MAEGTIRSWVIVFHVFSVIIWMGSLMLIASMLSMVTEEIGAARERMIVIARRLFHVGCNIGAVGTVFFGILLILLEPEALLHGWLHVKLVLVAAMLYVHYRLYRRILALESDPAGVSSRQFKMIHGIVSALLLGILWLAIIKPF